MRMLECFLFVGSHFFSLAMYHCAAKFVGFFPFFLLFGQVLLSARLLMLMVSSKGIDWAAKQVSERFRHLLAVKSGSHSPSTLCLGFSLLCPSPHAALLSSALPLSTSLSSSHSSPFSFTLASTCSPTAISILSAFDVASLGNWMKAWSDGNILHCQFVNLFNKLRRPSVSDF